MKNLIFLLLAFILFSCKHKTPTQLLKTDLQNKLLGYFNKDDINGAYIIDSIQIIKIDTVTERIDSQIALNKLNIRAKKIIRQVKEKMNEMKESVHNIKTYRLLGANNIAKNEYDNFLKLKNEYTEMHQRDSPIIYRISFLRDSMKTFDSTIITGYALETNIFAHTKDNVSLNTKDVTFFFTKDKYLKLNETPNEILNEQQN